MKYDVKFSCGHTHTVQLFGKYADRERKIEYFERCGVCPDCYREMKEMENAIGCKEVKMHYAEYKKNYPDCKTKSGSYNREEKTIIVYVPAGYSRVES